MSDPLFSFPPPNPRCRVLKLQELVAHTETVNSVCLGKKSAAVMCTGGDDRVVNCWRVGKHQPIMTLTGHIAEVDTVTFDATEQHICAGSRSGVIKVWNCSTQQLYRTLSGHRASITALDFHPFGDFFASGSSDCNVKVWDINQKACMQTYKGHTGIVTTVIHSPDGRWLVSGDVDGMVRVWDLTTTKVIHEMKTARKEPVVSLAFHPGEFLLAVASTHCITCWDMETFELISSSSREANPIKKITFDADGHALLSAQTDSLRVWGWEPSTCFDSVDVAWPGLTDLSISPNKELICVSKNKTVVTVQLLDLPLLAPFNSLASSASSAGDQENLPITSVAVVARKSLGSSRKLNGDGTEKENTWSKERTTPQQQQQQQQPLPQQQTITAAPTYNNHNLNSAANLLSPAATSGTAAIPFPSLSPGSALSSASPSSPLSTTKTKASILATPNAAFFKAHAAAASSSLVDTIFVPASFQTPGSAAPSTRSQQPITQPVAQPQIQTSAPVSAPAPKVPWPVRTANNNSSNPIIPAPAAPAAAQVPHTEQKSLSPRPIMSTPSLTSLSISPLPDNAYIHTPSTIQQQAQPQPSSLYPTISTSTPTPSFSPPPPHHQQAFPSLDDAETLRQCLLNEQPYINTILTQRRSHLSLLRRYWQEGDIKTCMMSLTDINEQAITFDFLHAIQSYFTQSNCLTLDLSLQLLPLLIPLFSSIVETHIQTAQYYVQLILNSFDTLIQENHLMMIQMRHLAPKQSHPFHNLDVVREERMEKCEVCWKHLQSIQNQIQNQIQRGGITAKILQDHPLTNALMRFIQG